MAFTETTSYQFPMWTQPNPAFNDGAHFRFEPLQTSHLKSNLTYQHPISVFLLSCSWVDTAIWFGHETCEIQRCQSSACCVAQGQASSAGTERTRTVQLTAGLCNPVVLWLTLRTICPLIPHLLCRCTHTHSKTHPSWNTNLQSVHQRCGGEADWSLWWQKLTTEAVKMMEGWSQMWREKALRAYTATRRMSCQRNNTGAHLPVSVWKSVCLHSVRLLGETF